MSPPLAGFRDVPRPILQFTLQSGDTTVQALGIVDSGSDDSVMPPYLARRLALWPPRPSEPLGGIGAEVSAGVVTADIRITLETGPLHFPSVMFRVPLDGERPELVILGRHPLFEHAQVTFQDWAARFAVEPRNHTWWPRQRSAIA